MWWELSQHNMEELEVEHLQNVPCSMSFRIWTSLKFFDIILFPDFLRVSIFTYMYVFGWPWRPEEDIKFPGAGVTLSHYGTGIWTMIFCESGKGFLSAEPFL